MRHYLHSGESALCDPSGDVFKVAILNFTSF